jgi:iron(III) transport system permease protein
LVFFGPTIGLVERLGRSGYPPTWDAREAWMHLQVVARLHGGSVAWMLAAALFTGLLTAALALACSWAMLDGPRFRTIVWSLAALCWALPAPAVGLGLKTFIGFVVEQVPPHSPLDWLLYRSGPTPIIWAHLIRFFPSALVILWPVVRMTASELRDAARLVGPASEFRLAVWPTSRSAFWAATMAVAALSLGEVGAATLVANPGSDTFAKLLLDTMHTGLDSTLAGLGLLLLGSGLALGVIVGFVWRRL